MIYPTLHFAACLVLVGAAFYRWRKASIGGSSHRFLFPFVIVVGLLAMIAPLQLAMEWFVAQYSGAIYTTEVISYRFNGPYWWFYMAQLVLPFAPVAAILPAIGRRPLVVGALGAVAILPAVFLMWESFEY